MIRVTTNSTVSYTHLDVYKRQVMIYFDQPTRDALVRRFYDAMNPGAYLFISHSESLNQNPLFQTVAPAVYRKK